MRLDHLLSKENVRCQITDVSYSKSTSGKSLMNLYNPFNGYFASIQSSGPERFMKKPSGGIAQLGERLPCKQEVAGSIPAVSTKQDIRSCPGGE